ncbi:RNA-binding protein [Flaviaesturariibacter flavus]|uniref:RNA-binding protein n=1 Tax=Flaviaesturariibacter flavus TaxID=2502780 RepID=A0A4R1B9J5_9BACT|nr:RNA-binding protein [Flaviaesturariibacter flavus]TCJ13590.1 RNA-binding protein [Flaviaesturariibacter flavus]
MQLLVNNVDPNLLESDLRRLFRPYGEISDVVVMRDKNSHRHLGRALVEMPVTRQAEAALSNLNGCRFGNRSLAVSIAPPTW